MERLAPAGVKDPDEQFILRSVVVGRLREGDAVVRVVGGAPAEAIGLDAFVAFAADTRRLGRDARQQAGRRVAGRPVGADRLLDRAEVVAVVQDADLVAVPFFAVDGVGLATHMVAHARGGKQVAFIGRVDEHLAGKRLAGKHGDLSDTAAVDAHALGAVEPFVAENRQAVFLHVIFKDFLGHAGFEDPHCPFVLIHRHGALAFVAEGFRALPGPGLLLLVLDPDAVVEVTSQTADDGLVAGVGIA